jgi:hypothetical protein
MNSWCRYAVHSANERALEHVEAAKERKEQRLLLPDYLLKRLRGYLDAEIDVIRKSAHRGAISNGALYVLLHLVFSARSKAPGCRRRRCRFISVASPLGG